MEQTALTATLDRIERDEGGNDLGVLVLDSGEQLILPLDRLPEGSREGSVLRLTLQLDIDATRRRAEAVRDRQSRLFGDAHPPDERT